MYVPWAIAAPSGALAREHTVHVELVGLEGIGPDALRGKELECEVRCGPLADAGHGHGYPHGHRAHAAERKPEGPKISTMLAAAPPSGRAGRGAGGGGGARLALAPGAPPLTFNAAELNLCALAGKRAAAGEAAGPWCRLKLWGGHRHAFGLGNFLGEAAFAVPLAARGAAGAGGRDDSALVALKGGKVPGVSVRLVARWSAFGRDACTRMAELLGQQVLEAAAQRRWPQLAQLVRLAVAGGWGEALQEDCLMLVVSKVDSEGRSALHLCAQAVGMAAGTRGGREGPDAAAAALLDAGADQDAVAGDGDSPLTAALRAGGPCAPVLAQRVPPAIAKAAGLSAGAAAAVDWEVLREARRYALVLFCAERARGATAGAEAPAPQPLRDALSDALYFAVSRRHAAMGRRLLAVTPPLAAKATTADVLLLEQMLRLSTGPDADPRWLQAAEMQVRRGEAANAWRGGQRVERALAQLAAGGEELAERLLLDVALGPEQGRFSDEPCVLFPERASECAVCFEPLYQNAPAYFLDEAGQRSCMHYVCSDCAPACASQKECPMCRVAASECRPLPSIEHDPAGWFAVASCGDGQLDPAELCHAVAACLPVKEEKLLEALEAADGPWRRWDANHNGTISEAEFFAPRTGLHSWILAHMQELHRQDNRQGSPGAGAAAAAAPDIRADPGEWFDFWDTRDHGALSFGELLRGVFASRRVSALEARGRLLGLRAEVKDLWRNAALGADVVTKAQFLQPEGLASQLADSFRHASVPDGAVEVASLPKPVSPVMEPARPSQRGSGASAMPPGMEALMAMGFPQSMATEALQLAEGDVERAVAHLLRG